MKQTLQLRTSQHLALTPQLQQSIRLLQLSTLELHQELEQILADNPLLERLDDPLDHSVRLLADGAIAANTAMPESATAASSEPAAADASDTTTDAAEADDGRRRVELRRRRTHIESARGRRCAAAIGGATHHPARTSAASRRGEMAQQQRDRALVELVIDALNENGYLEEPLDDIHARLPPQLGHRHRRTGDRAEAAAELRSGRRRRTRCGGVPGAADPAPAASAAGDTAAWRCRSSRSIWRSFAQRDFNKLKKALDCDDEDLREAQAVIRQCNPHPGAAFASDTSDYVVPDVIVKRTRAGWQVTAEPGRDAAAARAIRCTPASSSSTRETDR